MARSLDLVASDEVSRAKPTPKDEAERGTLLIESALWDVVALFLRQLNATTEGFLGNTLPNVQTNSLRKWMGGNPNVQPDTTRKACLRNRAKAATLFTRDLVVLSKELSITVCFDQLGESVEDVRKPYRAYLEPMIQKLHRTKDRAEQGLAHGGEEIHMAGHLDSVSVDGIYLKLNEFYD